MLARATAIVICLIWASAAEAACPSWLASLIGATCALGEGVVINTQTATGTTQSLQFFGGNFPNNYAALTLDCKGITATSGTVFTLVVGEGLSGAPPTWQTSPFYTNAYIYASPAGLGGSSVTNATSLIDNWIAITSGVFSLVAKIDNPGSTTIPKSVSIEMRVNESAGFYKWEYGSFWNSDVNPLTGIELVGTNNLTGGSCTLYGKAS